MPRSARWSTLRLKIVERLTGIAVAVQFDAVQPLLADDAAPQRVVAVEHDAFLGLTLQYTNDASQILRKEVQERLAERCLPDIAAAMVERGLGAQEQEIAAPICQEETGRTVAHVIVDKLVESRYLRGRIGTVGR